MKVFTKISIGVTVLTLLFGLVGLIEVLFFSILVNVTPLYSVKAGLTDYVNVGIIKPVLEPLSTNIGIPIQINIPSISVNSLVEKVGISEDGSMDVPKNPKNVGWYMFGPKPGEVGSSAIAGHINWWNGVDGIFDKLHKLKPGDEIVVSDENDNPLTFVVRKIKTFEAKADASEVFVSDDGKSHLNLITCSGKWNKRAQQYSTRLVVFADLLP